MHANAHGISISNNNIEKLHTYANESLAEIDFGENVYDINFERISADNDIEDVIIEISKYPDLWGTHNPTPLISIKDILINNKDIQILGAKKNTIKITKNNITYIKFNAEQMIEKINELIIMNGPETYFKLDVVGTANINEWNGTSTSQLVIEGWELKIDNGF